MLGSSFFEKIFLKKSGVKEETRDVFFVIVQVL